MLNPQPAGPSVLTGGCLCGAIRYEARGAPFDRTVCHCSICRRSTGAPMVAWFSVKLADFAITAGQPSHYRSSAWAVRSCCPTCGTQLTFKVDGLEEIDVTVCSLDDPAAVPPDDHTYVSSQLNWVQLDDGLPRHDQARFDQSREFDFRLSLRCRCALRKSMNAWRAAGVWRRLE